MSKIRSGFVTNSSSSSFILAFKNQKELDEFYENAEYDYEEFAELIKELSENPKTKEDILNIMYRFYSFEYENEIFDEYIKDRELSWTEKFNLKAEVNKEQWFIDKVYSYVINNTDYLEKKKQVEESEIIIDGMIWDTNGGLLEWAIRNGYIEDNFRRNCVMVYNVG